MSETDNKPTLGRKPLGLKRSVEAGGRVAGGGGVESGGIRAAAVSSTGAA